VATPLGWSTVAFVYIGMNAAGRSLSFQRAVLAGLPDWYFWAFATPLVFWLGDRFRVERGSWVRAAGTHLLAGTLVALAELALVVGFNRLVGVPTFAGALRDVYLRVLLQYFHLHFMIYWVIVAAAHATRYYRSYRAQELEASRLQAELTETQLAALRMQLQPHFFFNTLHTIATLVRDGRREAATDTIARLGDLFRETLGNVKRNEIPLRDELKFVDAYLDIERVRFSDRLTVRVDVEPGTLDACLPSMALQPLVENAIRHGIARDPSARLVAVQARRRNGYLRIEVRNDGPRYEPDTGGPPSGVGLSNVRARLSRLYGVRGRLAIMPGEPSGAVAVLEIPWRTDGP
jgi:signal transduction histidine kinase